MVTTGNKPRSSFTKLRLVAERSSNVDVSKDEVKAVIVFLVGTIGVLWVMIKAWFNRDQKKLQTCEEMYREALAEIKEIHGKCKYLEGRMDGVEKLGNSLSEKMTQRRAAER